MIQQDPPVLATTHVGMLDGDCPQAAHFRYRTSQGAGGIIRSNSACDVPDHFLVGSIPHYTCETTPNALTAANHAQIHQSGDADAPTDIFFGDLWA